MHLFTVEDYGTTVRHVPLSKAASPRVEARFRELVANYWALHPTARPYQPGYSPDPGEVLEHQRTLISYHLSDGAALTLTWTGSGV